MEWSMALTARAVATAKDPGRYPDSRGLVLEVSKSGGKSWALRFMLKGRARQMGLGPHPTVTLAEARELAEDARRLLKRGVDPIEARRASATEAVSIAKTFKQVAESLIESHEAGWRNQKSPAQWRASLDKYVYPTIGKTPVADVDTKAVLNCLKPIWSTKPETAARVRGRIEAVLNAAKVHGLRSGDNPAQWRGHLALLLPPKTKVRRVKHHAALPYAETPEFMAALRTQPGFAARALEFAILTGARTSEALGATWSEIDLTSKIWVIPAERMKAHREHRVPLSAAVIALLSSLVREGEYLFPGAKEGKPLSNMALLMTLRRMGRSELTAHGFRSTFRDWAAETTVYPSDVVEMALAHTIGNKVEAAYRRGDLFDKRRGLMDEWAAFCMNAAARQEYPADASPNELGVEAVTRPDERVPETVDPEDPDPSPVDVWLDALAAVDRRGDARKLIELLQGPVDGADSSLIADLLGRRVGKDAATEEARKRLLAEFTGGTPTRPALEKLAAILEAGVLGRPRGRQREPAYAFSIPKWRCQFAKGNVMALVKERRADGRRVRRDDAIAEVAPTYGMSEDTLETMVLGKHGGQRRRMAKRKAARGE
jgi:integrase